MLNDPYFVRAAGLSVFNKGLNFRTQDKGDDSPVTGSP
jgi:hypothetical protein